MNLYSFDDNSIDLLITSPPYNGGKIYEKEVGFHTFLAFYNEFAKTAVKKKSLQGKYMLGGGH